MVQLGGVDLVSPVSVLVAEIRPDLTARQIVDLFHYPISVAKRANITFRSMSSRV